MGITQGKGSIQDYKDNIRLNNQIAPSKIDYIVQGHQHLDHVGLAPKLYKHGFNGNIITVSKVSGILRYMWEDSKNITSGVARLLNRFDNTNKYEPLYDREHIKQALDNIIELDYYEEFHIGDDMYLSYIKAGHIFRSGMIVIKFKDTHRKLVYTGDIGSNKIPYYFVEDMDEIPNANVVIAESTYAYSGSSNLNPEFDREDLLSRIKDTLKNNKTVLIPSFALQRTPEILYFLYDNLKDFDYPFEVILDSPLSYNLYRQYNRHFEKLNDVNLW